MQPNKKFDDIAWHQGGLIFWKQTEANLWEYRELTQKEILTLIIEALEFPFLLSLVMDKKPKIQDERE